jgi:NDP-sugar pyrophosphorylase family protein
VEHLLSNLAVQGFATVHLAVGYHAELIQAYLGDGSRLGLRISYYREERRLGTAGPVRMVRDHFSIKEPVLAVNADILTKLDFAEMFDHHERQRAALTVGVRTFSETIPFGRLAVGDDGRVKSIEEKPTISFPVSAGIYIIDPAAMDAIPPNTYFDMPDLVTALIAAGRSVSAYQITQPWTAIEDAADWQRVMSERKSSDDRG